MNIAAILPCRGRAEQTVTNVRRLLATAGLQHGRDWLLYLAGGEEEVGTIWRACSQMAADGHSIVTATSAALRVSYWRALEMVTQRTDAPLLCNLANDVLPGQHWLRRAVEAYQQTFGDGLGLLGFNGDSHETNHSCHFLISRSLLDHYGGWPIWYDHNFGDTELCQRAITDGLYAKAPWALLYHDHPYWGGRDDAVYQEGRKAVSRDEQLYLERKRLGWPPVPDVGAPLSRLGIDAVRPAALATEPI